MCATCGCGKKKGQAGFGKGKGSAMDNKAKASSKSKFSAKKMGKKGKKLTTPTSEETADVNRTSPVAQRKELKDLYK